MKPHQSGQIFDYLKLHFVILLWGFTGILGDQIPMPATQMVWVRSLLATLILAAVLPKRINVHWKTALALIGNGMLLGFHWVLFFTTVKIANVSICMIGMATVSFWTAMMEPLMVRSVRMRWINVLLGCIIIAAVYWIYRNETSYHLGLGIALLAAIIATVFSIFNGQLAPHAHPQTILMYEMAGAALFCTFAQLIGPSLYQQINQFSDASLAWPENVWQLSALEIFYFALLVLAGTILAYQIYIELLDRLSVFTINFANNLEPVYGISLGALILQENHELGGSFYIGTLVMLAVVIAQPWLNEKQERQLVSES